jgi:hypothetical protein
MSGLSKTQALERRDVPIEQLEKSGMNPNKMKSREFDLLVDNINQTGLTDPVLIRPIGKNKYRIVGGHHRYDAAAYLGFTAVPCTIINDPDFDDDAEKFQLVRMNVIRGRMDPQKFFDLYQSVSEKYSDTILQDAFGFAEEAEFKKMIEQTAATISDPVMKEKFKEAAKEIKTIDGLSRLLNDLFTRYGDTLPYAFMVFDYGGQRSVWLQVSDKTIAAFDVIGEICREKSRTVDDVIGGLLQLAAKGELKDVLAKLIAASPAVKLPTGMTSIPTKQNIEQVAAVDMGTAT